MSIKTRKGFKRLLYVMKCSVIICMAIVITSGILSIYGAQKTIEAFDGNCIYTTKNISFMPRDERALIIAQTTPRLAASYLNTTTTTTEPVTESTTKEPKIRRKKISHIFRSLESDDIAEEEPDEKDEVESIRLSDIDRDDVKSETDINFLSSMEVDVVNTIWSTMGACEYILYNQVLSVIVGMVCTTMLVLYNTAGKAQLDWGIPKPWRIVFPAVISFGIMSIVELIHLLIVNRAQREFCDALSANITTKSLPCYKLINALHTPSTNSWISPGASFLIHTVSIRMTLLGWLGAFLVMLARMLFAIDFRLVRVTISSLTHQRKSIPLETISSESYAEEQRVEPLQEVRQVKPIASSSRAERSLSSREDVDEFQSAHSYFEPMAGQPTSLDPLLPSRETESPTDPSQA